MDNENSFTFHFKKLSKGFSITILFAMVFIIMPLSFSINNNVYALNLDNISKTYANPFIKFQLTYPKNWTVIEYPYNPISNNTIVGFYSNAKASSELGNMSGVSGNFVPYLDVYEFNSKNMSLNDLSQSLKNKFNNNTNIAIDEIKPIILKGNRGGFEIVFDVIVGNEEHFKKIQTYTIIGNKTYVLTFTAQRDLFADYLPIVHNITSSFGPTNQTQ
jgi:hypothetical protein